jgi:hypothetical protein
MNRKSLVTEFRLLTINDIIKGDLKNARLTYDIYKLYGGKLSYEHIRKTAIKKKLGAKNRTIR